VRARKEEQGAFTLARLGELSLPKQGINSLKTRMTRLSDSSHRRPGRASANLA